MSAAKRQKAAPDASDFYDAPVTRSTLRFLTSVAAQIAGKPVVGGRTIGTAYLYSSAAGGPFSDNDAKQVGDAIAKLVADDKPITTESISNAEALSYFEKNGLYKSAALLKSRVQDPVSVHKCNGIIRLALAPVFPKTSALAESVPGVWSIYGHLAVGWGRETCSESLLSAAKDHAAWGTCLGVDCVGQLNALRASNREQHDFILQCEFRQEAQLAKLASAIADRCSQGGDQRVGVVCIAGPTSSGKTTFATKLTMYLRNLGLTSKALTVDHYYLPLDRQPKYQARKQRSDIDYDAIESMDTVLVNEHINALLRGEKVMAPVYNMKTGYRDGDGVPFELPKPVDKSLLIIEGIHALNPAFLESVPAGRVFKVYISPLSALGLDEAHCLKTTDNRLLRRMSRDYLFRGNSASRTLSMWANVRRGEHRWIFPFQNNVDFMVNSSHEYEMLILKPLVEPLLSAVPPSDPMYAKAQQLLETLGHFNPASTSKVPTTSLLREFIGDGAFDCH